MMRRRHVKSVREEERPTLLLMAAGAVAGAAAGLYLGRRYRSMDAFLADMKDRFGDLRELWMQDDLVDEARVRLAHDAELEDEDADVDELDDFDDEDFDDMYHTASLRDDEDVIDEDETDDDIDEDLDDDLASVTTDNGADEGARRAEAKARRLERRVLDELRDEPVLGQRPIEIAVVGDGVVELTGTVNSLDEVARAAALVRDVPGVGMVLNRVEVRSGGHVDTASVPREPVEET